MHDTEYCIFRYKYLPFDDGSLEIIKSGTIKFSSSSDFNDPFDCKPWYMVEDKFMQTDRGKSLLKRVSAHEGLSPARRLQKKEQYKKRITKKIESGDFIKDINKTYGVLCLSNTPLNILMWSHYAQNHKGFMVEFKIETNAIGNNISDLENLLIPLPIKYKIDRPLIGVFEETTHENLEKHLLTKSEDWKYENEERLIDHIRGPGIHAYNRNSILCAVIAGIGMTQENKDKLAKIISETNMTHNLSIGFFEAKEIAGKYAISVPNHDRLDTYRQ